jgi:hypothetical protein
MECAEPSHRKPDDVDRAHFEGVEHIESVLYRVLLGVGSEIVRDRRGWVATSRIGNASEPSREVPDLEVPASMVTCELMDEEERRPDADLLDVEGDVGIHR